MDASVNQPIQVNNRFRWAAIIMMATFLGLAWMSYSQEAVVDASQIADLPEGPLAGYQAIEFTLPTLEGETFSLSEYRGQPVILNFWASWCGPCLAELPLLERTAIFYRGRVTILGINNGESIRTVEQFAQEHDLSFPLLLDDNYLVGDQYLVTALPTTFFIDQYGVIQEVFTGILNEGILQDRIEALLNAEVNRGQSSITSNPRTPLAIRN
ncbi:MAG: TlpA disulfide reductase family protein [Candidatus Promineifilaceae bacterium]